MRMLVFIAMLVTITTIFAQARERGSAFSREQAAAGAIAIRDPSFTCTDCHTSSLRGRTGADGELPPLDVLRADYQKLVRGNGGRVPALAGPEFAARWANRSIQDLVTEFKRRFEPPMSRFDEATQLNMIAYVLQVNGATPGGEPLTATSDVRIGSLIPSTDERSHTQR
jgi:hypothetical protein